MNCFLIVNVKVTVVFAVVVTGPAPVFDHGLRVVLRCCKAIVASGKTLYGHLQDRGSPLLAVSVTQQNICVI